MDVCYVTDCSLSGIDLDRFEEEEEAFEKKQSCIYRLLVATYFAIVARLVWACHRIWTIDYNLQIKRGLLFDVCHILRHWFTVNIMDDSEYMGQYLQILICT
ncbi:hypothetical protein DPMN_169626 [Dreissena polymorpha]|uniref:Uncharacterized protein n=1 Tax=Dreissena polymorpha TaxID=45954 RepID=A0A9D4DUZ9_DREPO|nr:hypothetical protein DPMN_169626 [Dreissena polymorpha]